MPSPPIAATQVVDPHSAPDTHTAAPIDHSGLFAYMAEVHHLVLHG